MRSEGCDALMLPNDYSEPRVKNLLFTSISAAAPPRIPTESRVAVRNLRGDLYYEGLDRHAQGTVSSMLPETYLHFLNSGVYKERKSGSTYQLSTTFRKVNDVLSYSCSLSSVRNSADWQEKTPTLPKYWRR